MIEPGGTGAPADSDPSPDTDFTSESASVAFTEAPSDTTVDAIEGEVSRSAADAGPDVAAADEGSASAKPNAAAGEAAAARVVKPVPPKKAASQPSGRVAQLKHEIDTLTHSKHKTAAELATDQDRLTKVRAEIAELEKKRGTAAAPAAAAAEAPKPAADPEPEHPEYRNFDTDEAYDAARATWRKDHAAWDGRRLEALKKEITEGVEARFTSKDEDVAARAAHETIVTAVDKFAATKPDWEEKRAAVKDITSSWYNPEIHGKATTPFLSDLSQSLMLAGREEGAELLHWLGSDPDRAQRLADLLPTRPLRDALVHAPSVIPLLTHFATDAGALEFERFKQMHPIPMMQAVGALITRLTPAPRGSGAAAHPVTAAYPSARPPAGTSGARSESGGDVDPTKLSFDDWMAAEDAKETKERLRQAGVSA